MLLSDFQSERRPPELHVVALCDGEEFPSAADGNGLGGAVLLLSLALLRGRGAVRHDLVEVGQVLSRGVDVADAVVVAGPPGVRDVHGAAAVSVERDGPQAAADAAGRTQLVTYPALTVHVS